MSFEIPCAALMVLAAWMLNEWPARISLYGAQEVMFLAMLESSSECSRCSMTVVLMLLEQDMRELRYILTLL